MRYLAHIVILWTTTTNNDKNGTSRVRLFNYLIASSDFPNSDMLSLETTMLYNKIVLLFTYVNHIFEHHSFTWYLYDYTLNTKV